MKGCANSSISRRLLLALSLIASLTIWLQGYVPSTAAQSSPPSSATPNTTCPPGGICFADVPPGNPFYDFANRIYRQDLITGFPVAAPASRATSTTAPTSAPAPTSHASKWQNS